MATGCMQAACTGSSRQRSRRRTCVCKTVEPGPAGDELTQPLYLPFVAVIKEAAPSGKDVRKPGLLSFRCRRRPGSPGKT